jgi:DNA-binding response OmpR family regulator
MKEETKRIAIVEDDIELARAIGTYLYGRGYEVELFAGYSEAKQKFDDKTDLVVIDLNLGDGDGMKLLQFFKSKHANTKQIIFTGYDSLPKRLQSFALGADDYMKKPIFPSELEARIKRLLSTDVITSTDFQRVLTPGQLSPLEERTLRLLLSTNGAPVPLATLQSTLGITQSALYTCLSRLKKKVTGVYEIKCAYGRGWWPVYVVTGSAST